MEKSSNTSTSTKRGNYHSKQKYSNPPGANIKRNKSEYPKKKLRSDELLTKETIDNENKKEHKGIMTRSNKFFYFYIGISIIIFIKFHLYI